MRTRTITSPLALVALVVAAGLLVTQLVPSLNPFRSETTDRSQPVLLQSLTDLSEFRAVSANLQEIVDIETGPNFLPSFIAGERTLLVAAGSVDGAVDFRGLRGENVRVSETEAGDAVTLTLPAPRLTGARVDLERTRVVDTDRGIGNRIEDMFSDDTDRERELLALAQRRLAEAARRDPQILRTAERNTREMLTGLLRGLGFERVTIRFAPPPPS
jgi:hypothetical protein